MLNEDTRIVRSDQVSQARIGTEGVVILSPCENNYFHLETTGQRIWDLLSEETSVAEVVVTLLDEYDVSADECREQTLELCRQLHAEGLILIVDDQG